MGNTQRRLRVTLLVGGALLAAVLIGSGHSYAQQLAESVRDVGAPEGINLTFPVPGQVYTRIPAITGEVTNPSLQIDKVFLRVYDQTTGKYYDGSNFSSTSPLELAAYGNRSWILETPGTFTNDHVFIVGVRGETATGQSINFPERFNFGVNKETPTAQTPPAVLEPDYALLDAIINGAQADRDKALKAYIDSVTRTEGTPITIPLSPVITTGTGSNLAVAQTETNTSSGAVIGAVTTTTVETHSSAPTGTGTNLCSYTPEQFIRENSVTSLLRQTCASPEVMQSVLQLSPEESYNIKYKEYYDRGLLKELPAGQLNTVGLRDSDQDGLSDKAELALGTDPFYWDTDQDKTPDGAEVLNHGSNPLKAESTPATEGLVITNVRDGMRTKDPRPLIVGNGKPNAPVRLYEIRDGKREMLIGEENTDEGGTFLIEPFVDLQEGEHRVAVFYADNSGQSQTVYFIIDNSLNVPAPEVTKISSTRMKPQVYGTTIFGSTVIGHFQSTTESSAVISDTPSGEFVVTSARALNTGHHKVILYATLPNNVRSEKVTIPFTMAEDGTITLDTFPYWWILGGAAILLLLAVGARMLRKPDTALYSIDRHELMQLESTNRIGQLIWESKQPLSSRDLGVKYLGFYLNTWAEDKKELYPLKDFIKAQPGMLIALMDIQEMYLLPEGGGEPVDILFGKEIPKDVRGYSIRYIVNMPKELINKYFPAFDGKKLVELSKVEHYTGKLSATLRTKNEATSPNA